MGPNYGDTSTLGSELICAGKIFTSFKYFIEIKLNLSTIQDAISKRFKTAVFAIKFDFSLSLFSPMMHCWSHMVAGKKLLNSLGGRGGRQDVGTRDCESTGAHSIF